MLNHSKALQRATAATLMSLALMACADGGAEPTHAAKETPVTTASDLTEAANRKTVEAAFEAWNAGTGGPYDLLAEEASWTIVGQSVASKTYPNRESFMSEVIRPFNARMSEPLKPTVRDIITEGDKVVIFFDAAGVAKDGKPYVNTYAWFWTMADGKVVQAHAFFDSVVFNDFWSRVAPTDAT